jgi:hypothetical protein
MGRTDQEYLYGCPEHTFPLSQNVNPAFHSDGAGDLHTGSKWADSAQVKSEWSFTYILPHAYIFRLRNKPKAAVVMFLML